MIIDTKNKFLHLSLKSILRGAVLFLVFIISIVLGNLYTEGDQVVYIKIYDGIADYNITDAYLFYTFNISSIELVHFIIVWIASNLGIDKIIFMAICNTLLSGLLIKLFDNLKVNFAITSFFILTNFYLYILFFAAERLKFGFIFFLLCILFKERHYMSLFFLIASILSHLQMLILYSGKMLELSVYEIKHFLSSLQVKWLILFVLPIIGFGFYLIQPTLLQKIVGYGRDTSLVDFLRITIFFLLSMLYAKDRKHPLLYFFPLFVAVYFIGGGRINMIAYIVSLYYCLSYNRGMNLGILITSLYFLYLNVTFIWKILLYGNGFAP